MKKGTKIALGVTIPIIGIPVIALMILIIIYGSMFLMSYIERMGETELDIYVERWDIVFPENIKVTFDYSSQGGFTGDGENYTICKFEQRPDSFLRDFSQDNYDEFITGYNSAVKLITEEGLDCDKIITPTEDDNFIWKSIKKINNSIYFVYSENNNTLYILENIM